MSLRNVPYAGTTNPQMVFLDQTFADVAALGIVPCTAAGTNLITLTPNANTPTISAYANYLQFSFVALHTFTGSVTLQVGSLSALPVYAADGTTQLGSGAIVINDFYVVAFNQALNGGNGGWTVVSASANGITVGTYNTVTVDASGRVTASAALRGYLAGMSLSNDTSSPSRTLNISAGNVTDSANSVSIVLSSTFNKSIGGSWAAGSGSNGLGTGITLTSSTWYHVFPIINSGTADAYFDTTSSGANAPTNTTSFRRVGSVLTNNASTSGQIGITAFVQNGDDFLWSAPVVDFQVTNPGTAAVLRTLTIPTSVRCRAWMTIELSIGTVGTASYLSSPDQADVAPAVGVAQTVSVVFTNGNLAAPAWVWSNAAQQIRTRLSASDGSTVFTGTTIGWTDQRGKN